MNKCKFESCSNEAVGSSAYCSNSCRAKESKRNRTGATIEAQPEQTEAQPQAQQPSATLPYVAVNSTVYNRPAVSYRGDQWQTRPSPLSDTDQPHIGGRGKYTRADGSVYQFDSSGTSFEVVDGKVYQTTEDVQACYVVKQGQGRPEQATAK